MRKYLILALVSVAFTFTACNSGGTKSSSTESAPTEVVGVDQATIPVGTEAVLAVGGSCDMCTDRIIKTVSNIDGYIDASYDLEKQELNLTFDSNKTSVDAISKALADVGHDTDLYKSAQDVYDALPGCCHYRK